MAAGDEEGAEWSTIESLTFSLGGMVTIAFMLQKVKKEGVSHKVSLGEGLTSILRRVEKLTSNAPDIGIPLDKVPKSIQ